jgi:transcriptional regulator with GAF, ATPase, and Fis domain
VGQFNWYGSAEAEAHPALRGRRTRVLAAGGLCLGFVSRFLGRPVVFREICCRAQGAPHCVVLGKPAEHWDDAEGAVQSLRADKLSMGPSAAYRQEGETQGPLGDVDVVGVSAGFNAVCHMVRRPPHPGDGALPGESGVGKEVLAQSLHRISARSDGPFVAINCAAIPEDLIESELFGVEKGAFTGALATRAGRFERADGGTLFLDEIGDPELDRAGQALRALQEREIERVGGTQARKVDVRVVAATNLDLREEVKAGRFREDLYFRLNVLPIRVPRCASAARTSRSS